MWWWVVVVVVDQPITDLTGGAQYFLTSPAVSNTTLTWLGPRIVGPS